MIGQDPSCEILYTLEVNSCQKRMLCLEILVHILNDGHRHYLIVQQAIHGLDCLLFPGLDQSLIEALFLRSEYSESSLHQDLLISMSRLIVCQYCSSNGIAKALKRCFNLSSFRCICCEYVSQFSSCILYHRILSKHVIIPPS